MKDLLTSEFLLEIEFIKKEINNQIYYEKETYVLVPEFGTWVKAAVHDNQIVCMLTYLNTREELYRDFLESTGKQLSKNEK